MKERATKETVSDLLEVIRLEQLEENLFRGQSRNTGQRSIFGGLVAGQALMAAARTVPEDRPVHSLHSYFLRPGDFNIPIIYDVDRIRDGKSFTTRRVTAIQHGRAIFSLEASFQLEEGGVEHQADMPDVPAPETLETDRVLRERIAHRIPENFREAFLAERPVEFRPVKPENSFEAEPQDPSRMVWFRIADTLDVDVATHRALLAFCSDFGLLGTSMLPHGMNFFQPHVQSASIDHAMWFHRPFRVDEWLLYSTFSPSASGARGMNLGYIYRADGVLAATVAQEGLMRLRPQEPRA
ncbi:acyl-CoA thioesterase II [Alcanivorax sp. JB21]|uniref:acyl-CoA thioesterase II n=1 Tax=Alcanivorax limicola TaxID=2874102 RepID=UPI001CC088BB|nr:acyl-CoA thioesterase II [Alcanivorax limicola]MBZ2188040.1 acyl-CoA thioesterase II [Alcanivorax limicola]